LKFSFETENDYTPYNPGEHIALLPQNLKSAIAHAAASLSSPPFDDLPLQLENKRTAHVSWNTLTAFKEFPGLTYEQYLTHCVDLSRIPADVEQDLTEEVDGVRYKYSAAYIGRLNKIDKRVYSIASADSNKGEVSVLLSLHTFQHEGEVKMGLLSKFIKGMLVGETILGGFLAPAECMYLQQDPALPMILISAGSGFAPFMSFIEQRADEAMGGGVVGKIIIFHGCWDKDGSFTGALVKEARVYLDIEIFIAYSREKGQNKEYVQDVMYSHSNLLKHAIEKRCGAVYVCGSGAMVGGVRKQLESVLDDGLEDLITSHKYQEERFN